MKSIVSTSTNRSKRAPTVDDLFKAIVTLRNKLPNKSLEQTIIRLHQCINHKKQSDSMSNASRRSKHYEPSVCSRRDDFDESKGFGGTFTFDENFYESMKNQSEQTDEMDLKQCAKNDKLIKLMQYQIDRAKDFYAKAFTLLPQEDRFNQLPGLMMGNIYYDLLLRIEEGDLANILNERTQLTVLRKIWIIVLTFINKYN